MGLFGKLFDFNHDGKVDPVEEILGLGMIAALAEAGERARKQQEFNDLIEQVNSIPGITVECGEDPEGLSREELETMLDELQEQLDELEESEPDDICSEAYNLWEEEHEDLEERIEEIQDILDEMDG